MDGHEEWRRLEAKPKADQAMESENNRSHSSLVVLPALDWPYPRNSESTARPYFSWAGEKMCWKQLAKCCVRKEFMQPGFREMFVRVR